jgi:serine/threonine-protein kinase
MRRQVCEASGGRPSSRELLALRDACLDRRQGRLRALTAVFADKAGAEVLDRAVSAAASLPPVSDCADAEALLARVRPPDDPAVKSQVAKLQPRVDRLGAMYDSGQWQAALAESEDVVSAAMTVPYPPLRAQAQYWRGVLLERTGDYERAMAQLRNAAPLAAQGHDDALASLAWTRILYILGERQRKVEEAAAVRAFGETLLARAHDDFASLMWFQTEGLVEDRTGHFADALALEQRALALAEPLLGEDHPQVATVLNNVGLVQSDMGDLTGAIATHEHALRLRENVLGPDHPNVAQSLNNLGVALQSMGEPARARDAYARAEAIWEKDLGPEHQDVGTAIGNGSEALYAMGDVAGAINMGRRALRIREKALGPDHPQVAETLYDLGSYLRASGELDEASEKLERSLAIRERALGPGANDVCLSLDELARVRVAQKRLDDADRLLARARVCVRASPADDKATLGTELATAELLAARGRRAEAVSLIQRELPHTVPELRAQFEQALVSLEASPPR